MNFGPQHPAAHGVLRLVLELDGEVIERADPHIGLLHRATEKLAEHKTWIQSLPYMDRLDYVSMMCNEHAYCLAIERLLGIDVPVRALYIRTMFDEITRILNHLMWLGAHALDVGAMTTFLYCFREREDLFDMYEAVSGARMHAAYYRPGGVYRDLPDRMPQYQAMKSRNAARAEAAEREPAGLAARLHRGFHAPLPRLRRRLRDAADREPHLEAADGRHRRRHRRARAGAGIHRPDAARLGRAVGSAAQATVRRVRPDGSSTFPVGINGDCYDRYLVRVEEMRQSNRIVRQCIDWLRDNPGPVITDNHKVAPPSREAMKENMEELIHHFKLFTEGIHVPAGEVYAAIEHPKGEFGVYAISDGANKPYRIKLRPPDYVHLSALDEMSRGHMIADVVAIIGTQDIVFGSIDR